MMEGHNSRGKPSGGDKHKPTRNSVSPSYSEQLIDNRYAEFNARLQSFTTDDLLLRCVCRVCSSNCEEENVSILDNKSIQTLVSKYLKINVLENLLLPNRLCYICTKLLIDWDCVVKTSQAFEIHLTKSQVPHDLNNLDHQGIINAWLAMPRQVKANNDRITSNTDQTSYSHLGVPLKKRKAVLNNNNITLTACDDELTGQDVSSPSSESDVARDSADVLMTAESSALPGSLVSDDVVSTEHDKALPENEVVMSDEVDTSVALSEDAGDIDERCNIAELEVGVADVLPNIKSEVDEQQCTEEGLPEQQSWQMGETIDDIDIKCEPLPEQDEDTCEEDALNGPDTKHKEPTSTNIETSFAIRTDLCTVDIKEENIKNESLNSTSQTGNIEKVDLYPNDLNLISFEEMSGNTPCVDPLSIDQCTINEEAPTISHVVSSQNIDKYPSSTTGSTLLQSLLKEAKERIVSTEMEAASINSKTNFDSSENENSCNESESDDSSEISDLNSERTGPEKSDDDMSKILKEIKARELRVMIKPVKVMENKIKPIPNEKLTCKKTAQGTKSIKHVCFICKKNVPSVMQHMRKEHRKHIDVSMITRSKSLTMECQQILHKVIRDRFIKNKKANMKKNKPQRKTTLLPICNIQEMCFHKIVELMPHDYITEVIKENQLIESFGMKLIEKFSNCESNLFTRVTNKLRQFVKLFLLCQQKKHSIIDISSLFHIDNVTLILQCIRELGGLEMSNFVYRFYNLVPQIGRSISGIALLLRNSKYANATKKIEIENFLTNFQAVLKNEMMIARNSKLLKLKTKAQLEQSKVEVLDSDDADDNDDNDDNDNDDNDDDVVLID